VPVAVLARQIAAPDALAARDGERLAQDPLARPGGRELPHPRADDVLVGPEADHPAPARVDVHELPVAVGDRDPVRRRLDDGAEAALGGGGALARRHVLVDDEHPAADPRRRHVEAALERAAAHEGVPVVELRAQRAALFDDRDELLEELARELRQRLQHAAARQLAGGHRGGGVGVVEDEVDDGARVVAQGRDHDRCLRKLVERPELGAGRAGRTARARLPQIGRLHPTDVVPSRPRRPDRSARLSAAPGACADAPPASPRRGR
jgi:hypothetical protein